MAHNGHFYESFSGQNLRVYVNQWLLLRSLAATSIGKLNSMFILVFTPSTRAVEQMFNPPQKSIMDRKAS